MVWISRCSLFASVSRFLVTRLSGESVFFSVFLGFLEEAIAVLYKVPNLAEMTSGTALSTILGAILWGVLLGYLVPRFARRQERQKAG